MDFTPHKPYDFIRGKCLEATKVFGSGQGGLLVSTGFKKEILINWKSPPDGWLKLNIDGAVKGNPGPAGGGGLLRDHRGNWINGFSANLGWCSYVKAELLALLKGLQLAWNMGVSHLEVEIDSHVALKLTQEPCKVNQAHCFVI